LLFYRFVVEYFMKILNQSHGKGMGIRKFISLYVIWGVVFLMTVFALFLTGVRAQTHSPKRVLSFPFDQSTTNASLLWSEQINPATRSIIIGVVVLAGVFLLIIVHLVINLKQRRQTETVLRISEERFRTLFNSINDAILIFDLEGRLLEVSQSCLDRFGYNRTEMMQMVPTDYFCIEGQKIIGYGSTLQENGCAVFDSVMRTHNGELIPVEVNNRMITYNGQPAVMSIARDISEHRKMEKERSHLAGILDASLNEIYLFEPDSLKFLYVNRGALKNLGYPAEKMLAMTPVDLKPDYTEFSFRELIAPLFYQQRVLVVESRHKRADGSCYPVEVHLQLIEHAEERVFLALILDLTERKRTEETLLQSEERLSLALQGADLGLWDWNIQSGVNTFNRRWAEMLGYTLEEVEHTIETWQALIHPEDAPRVLEKVTALQEGKINVYESEHRLCAKDGTWVWVLSRGKVTERTQDGKPLRATGTHLDITERKKAEETLEAERTLLAQRVEERTAELSLANAALSRAARMKDEFLASMSHELRTPLTGILGLSEALLNQVYGTLNESQTSSLQSIEESGHHLLDLINDILDLSKIEAGKTDLSIAPFRVESVCHSSLRMIHQSAHKKGLKVMFDFDGENLSMRADERRLKQILVNLLSNAVKFTNPGGTVGLRVVGDTAQEVICFSVWDTGVGIARVKMSKLFQRFVQLDSRLSREYAGTGLGLALVNRLTEMLGGSVAVESEAGKGSCFTVNLPWKFADLDVEVVKTDSESYLAAPAHAARICSILVAEDNEAILTTYTDFLSVNGYRVISARNGAESLKYAMEKPPDLVLMDIQMPGMDGLEAIRNLRQIEQMRSVPIIAITALVMPGDRERCLAAGANDYLSKPVRLQSLLSIIRRIT